MNMKFLVLAVLISAVFSAQCPDKKSVCPGSTTCCALSGGQYGCCPYPEATCCKDGAHCCPNGYQCDLDRGACVRQGNNDFLSYVSMFSTLNPSEKVQENVEVNPEDFYACVKDLIRVAPELRDLIEDVKAKDIQNLIEVVMKLVNDKALLNDCGKLFK